MTWHNQRQQFGRLLRKEGLTIVAIQSIQPMCQCCVTRHLRENKINPHKRGMRYRVTK